ncbi:MAG: glutathione S-transferase family protein [Alphaproteobacteria bacterium]|nr:glutathione S-transferase family protein [Alphaproteobacteria bacterium]
MRTLYHLPLSPFCRQIRIAAAEKEVEITLRAEKVWERRPEFLALNPAGEVPVLVEDDGVTVVGAGPISEYFEDVHPDPPLYGLSPRARAEVRRLVAWFDLKFDREVGQNLVGEKVTKRFLGQGQPEVHRIRAGRHNIKTHLDYIAYLSDRRRWLAGDAMSLADIAAAAHLSTVDYIDEIPWDEHPLAKDWYVRMKSRPSLRAILADLIAGLPPPDHYADLDF